MPHRPLPMVSDHLLHIPNQETNEHSPVVVDSRNWYSWLTEELNISFSFRNALGTFTVRRERKRHGWYWYIYRKSGGKLRKAYLGKAEEVTFERLSLAAATLVSPSDADYDQDNGLHKTGEEELLEHPNHLHSSQQSSLAPAITSQVHHEPVNKYTLPTPLTPLIGRQQEVANACDLLRRAHVRLLVLTGPGGIGKTRLALRTATDLRQDFPAGVCFVPLESLRDPALVAPTIAHTLGLKETTSESVVDQLKSFLREQYLLLLLDNFEQVAPAAPLLTDLLATSPRLKMLVTSRTRLHVRGEHEYVVPPLALPDQKQLANSGALAQYAAVAFFLQCVWALQPDFQVSGTSTRAIAEICLRLEGVPLAIELAAARIKQLPPQALLEQLSHRLPVLKSGPKDAPFRQQALRNTLAWSYDLLDPWEQRLLRHLSVFVGGFTLQAAEAVCRADGDSAGAANVFDGIASLIDKSLLYQAQRDGEEPRFGMLEMTREYGQEMLAHCEETQAARQAHALYYLALVEQAAQAWEGPQHSPWLERLERDHDNLRVAMQWSLEQTEAGNRLEVAFRFGTALRSFWQVRGYFREGRSFLEQVLAQSEGSLPSWRSRALNDAVLLAISQGDHDWGDALCRENLLRCRELGDSSAVARALYLLGWSACLKGTLATAYIRLSESLALAKEVDDRGGILIALTWLGVVATYQGEYARARELLEQALAIQRKFGNKRGMGWPLLLLAWGLVFSQRDLTTARKSLKEAEELFKELGEKWGIAQCRWLSGQLALEQGDTHTARALLEQSVALYEEIGNRREIAHMLCLLGNVAMVQQDWARARALYEDSLKEAMAVNDAFEIVTGLEGIAGVVVAEKGALANVLWAAQLWGAAEALREKMGAPIPPIECTTYEEKVASTRSSIGKRIFAAYWAQGRTMTPEQALAAQGKASTLSQPALELSSIPSRNAANPAGLTAREVEVLCWVARGLTDAQVAAQLVISPRTVTSHLSSIYNKLGVNSRAAATRFAMDHQLI
jgi:predicted ATPase/DNA-binding CsgD family transcriptional regulator